MTAKKSKTQKKSKEELKKEENKKDIEQEFGKPITKWHPVSNIEKKDNFFSKALKFLGF